MVDMEDIAILARDLLILSPKLMLESMEDTGDTEDMVDMEDIAFLARDLLIQNPKLMPDISTEVMVDMEDTEGMVDMVDLADMADMDVSGDKRLSDKHKTWQEFI